MLVHHLAEREDIRLIPTVTTELLADTLRASLERITDEQIENPNFKVMGVLNDGGSHYVPYVISFKGESPLIEIIDPYQPGQHNSEASIQHVFNSVFAACDIHWREVPQQNNPYNCGANSVQTLVDYANSRQDNLTVDIQRDGPETAAQALERVLDNQYDILLHYSGIEKVSANDDPGIIQASGLSCNIAADGEVIYTEGFNINQEIEVQLQADAANDAATLLTTYNAARQEGHDVVLYHENDRPVAVLSKQDQVARDEKLALALQFEELKGFLPVDKATQMSDAQKEKFVKDNLTTFFNASTQNNTQSPVTSPRND